MRGSGILATIVAFAVVFLIYAYFTNAHAAYKINSIFSGVKDEVSEKVSQTQATIKYQNCEEQAKPLIPEYFLYGKPDEYYRYDTVVPAIWMDGQPITSEGISIESQNPFNAAPVSFTFGSAEGENVNYLYTRGSHLRYEKTMISDDGIVLGTRKFTVALTFKPVMLNITKGFLNVSDYVGAVEWSGFSTDIKRGLRVSNLTLDVRRGWGEESSANTILCRNQSTADEGFMVCPFSVSGNTWDRYFVIVEPDIVNMRLFQVTGAKFIDCTWTK